MFFLLVFAIFFAVNGYVYFRGLSLLPPLFWFKVGFSAIFWLFPMMFILRMFIGDGMSPMLNYIISAVAFTWFFAVIYLAMIVLAIDLLRVINSVVRIFPASVVNNAAFGKRLAVVIVLFVASLIIYGRWQFENLQVERFSITLDKTFKKKHIKVVLVSDLHLSNYLNSRNLEKVATLIENQQPHLVLIAGDLVDRSLAPVKENSLAKRIAAIETLYGVYAVSGNHEFYGGERKEIIDHFNRAGVRFLKDTSVVVAEDIILAGRDDITNINRLKIEEILHGEDLMSPVIMVDHQPYNLEEVSKKNVDIHLSGHTHNGQFWPGNLIVKWLYTLPYGYKKIDKTHFFVTSGAGIWGPKIRVGTQSEIVVIDIYSADYTRIDDDQ